MATPITFNGASYNVPAYGDAGWAQGAGNLSSYLIAIAAGTLQTTGGTFTLSAEANFGATYGLLAAYFKTRAASPATSGVLRLAIGDTIDWGVANNALGVSGTTLQWNGVPVLTAASSILPVANGGTGKATLTAHGVMIGEGTSAIAVTTAGTSGAPLLSGGASADPAFGALNLAGGSSSVTGTLPVANGGTNSATALSGSSIMVSNGSAVVQGAAGTATTVLHGNASGAPTYSAVSMTADVTGTLPVTNGGTGAATLTAHGVLLGEGTSAIAATAAGTSGAPLLSGGASADPAFGALNLAGGATAVTGVLPNANTTAASANTASAIVARDGSGNFTAGTITAALTGNATTATNLTAVAWSTWVPTSPVGCSSALTVNVARYSQVGKTVTVNLDISGTSNSTSWTVTLPVAIQNASGVAGFGCTEDNGGFLSTPGIAVPSSSTTFFLGKDCNAAVLSSWTASGTKRWIGLIVYEAV